MAPGNSFRARPRGRGGRGGRPNFGARNSAPAAGAVPGAGAGTQPRYFKQGGAGSQRPFAAGAAPAVSLFSLEQSTKAWWEMVTPLEPVADAPPLTATVLAQKRERGQSLMTTEAAVYAQKKKKHGSSDDRWLSTVLKNGTVSDRLAALSIQVQEAPIQTTHALELMLQMAMKKNHHEADAASDAIRDLFVNNLLPNRPLRTLAQQPLTHPRLTDQHLLLFFFEDFLKDAYRRFIAALEASLRSTIMHSRTRTITTIHILLSERPEGERVLLDILVNKMGDPERKLASKSAHLLTTLVLKHPLMKMHVVRHVAEFIFRPNVGLRAQYYAVIFLSQLILSHQEREIAAFLVQTYLSLFSALTTSAKPTTKQTKDGKDSETFTTIDEDQPQHEQRMLSAILTGINRAFPFSRQADKQTGENKDSALYEKHIDSLFRSVHVSSFATAIQALTLLFQLQNANSADCDRFYRTLYEALLRDDIAASTKFHPMFLNLLYKALKADTSITRVRAFIKRLTHLSIHQHPPFLCGALFIISELIKHRSVLASAVKDNEQQDEYEHYEDVDQPDKKKPTTKSEKGPQQPKDAEKSASYDPHKRDPRFSHAENAGLWEIPALTAHFHPTVALWAQNIATSNPIKYEGDPLRDFTLFSFLDRFSYRNPKKKISERGGSLMQPTTTTNLRKEPVNTPAFLQQNIDKIRSDEQFFFKYFSESKKQAQPKKKKETTSELDEDAESELDEEEIERALFSSMPDQEDADADADADGDDDFDFADLAEGEGEGDSDADGDQADEGEDEEDEEEERARREMEGESDGDLDDQEENFGIDEEDEFLFGDSESDEDDDGEAAEGVSGKRKRAPDIDEDEDDDDGSEEDKPRSKRAIKKQRQAEEESGKKKKKGEKFVSSSPFASAEEFAHLLEDDAEGDADAAEAQWDHRKRKSPGGSRGGPAKRGRSRPNQRRRK